MQTPIGDVLAMPCRKRNRERDATPSKNLAYRANAHESLEATLISYQTKGQ